MWHLWRKTTCSRNKAKSTYARKAYLGSRVIRAKLFQNRDGLFPVSKELSDVLSLRLSSSYNLTQNKVSVYGEENDWLKCIIFLAKLFHDFNFVCVCVGGGVPHRNSRAQTMPNCFFVQTAGSGSSGIATMPPGLSCYGDPSQKWTSLRWGKI